MCPRPYDPEGLKGRLRSDSNDSDSSLSEDSSCISVPHESSKSDETGDGRFSIKLTPQFLVLAILLATSFAFSIGAVVRILFHYTPPKHSTNRGMPQQTQIQFPRPVAIDGKAVPSTTITMNMSFHPEATISSNIVHLDRKDSPKTHTKDEALTSSAFQEDDDDGVNSTGNVTYHFPSGSHLLVDLKYVDPDFLNSEERLATAMVELFDESELTLLSYHCHSMMPMGVSCVGVLLESHVSFHTWPQEGVIIMDLFTCGTKALIPVLPVIMRLFALPAHDLNLREGDIEPPEPAMVWSHKLRGFRQGFLPDYKPEENPFDQEIGLDVLGRHDFGMKRVLVSEETSFQHVDIYELIRPQVSSYPSETLHPELNMPDKVLFLDGIQQSSLFGEAAYHEALVHPAMMTHSNPKRVAIIGGGEGATLREVLKHSTVEEVTMIELDKELVNLCEEHLPEWSDCSDLEGSKAESCFDDPRVRLVFEDAFKWFVDNFGTDQKKEQEMEFDVVIMDALDPDKFVAIVGSMYKDNHFVDALFNGLSDDGVLVVQLGESEKLSEPSIEMGPARDTANMMEALQSVGFESIHKYDDGHSHFSAPWSYLVCLKDSKSRASWYRTTTELEIELHQRLYGTKSSKPTLRYFDAPMMMGYQMPSKAQETSYCRSEAAPPDCEEYLGIDPEFVNIPKSSLEAKKSTVGEFAGRGLFAAQDIAQGSSLMTEVGVKSFHVLPSTWVIINDLYEWVYENEFHLVEDELSRVHTFTEGYGYAAMVFGETHYTIDAGITTFCNHGCNGTYTIGSSAEFTEMNVDPNNPLDVLVNKATNVYSPIFERHLRQILNRGDNTLRPIKKGEEILCDYLGFIGNPDDWKEDVISLRSQCSGENMGEIFQYESNQNGADE